MGEEIIGRVLEGTIHNARCEFNSGVQIGDPVTVRIADTEYRARIDALETSRTLGLIGYIIFLERPYLPPRHFDPVYKRVEEKEGILYIGKDYRGNDIRLDVNPLFTHTLSVGMTQQGKTHGMIVFLEELAKYGVPCIVFDTQGEFVNMPQVYPERISFIDNLTEQELLDELKLKHIVIINMLGLSNPDKARKLADILQPFIINKEADYARAENRYEYLEIPPTLIFVDEGEIYCPKSGLRPIWAIESALCCEEIAKRGSKIGMGLFISTQRIINLSIDVRDNCNSIMAFRVSGRSNMNTLGQMQLFTSSTLNRLKSLMRGECVMLGSVSGGGALTIKIRDIVTPRAKNVNFEEILGLDSRNNVRIDFEPSIRIVKGTVVDEGTQEVIITEKEKVLEEDKRLFEEADDDGIILRNEPLPNELIAELEKELGKSKKKLPFATHLTEEDEELIEELRKVNKKNDK